MRILVTSTPGTGHVHPLVPLARELVAAGHDVAWATADDSCARVEALGFRVLPAGLSLAARGEAMGRRSDELGGVPPHLLRLVGFPMLFGEVAAPRMCDDLGPVVDRFRPDVIVHDLAELAAPPVAAARELPTACVAFGLPLSASLVAATADAVAPLWSGLGLEPSPSAGLYDHCYLHPLPAALSDPPAVATARRIRPLHVDGAGDVRPPAWLGSFGRDRPGVYVTFGTEFGGRAPWREVVEAVSAVDADVVMTVGSTLDRVDPGALPDHVRVESYVPQRFLLERADAVVSHAGSGTLFATAARGLPQVCIPVGADQWENAEVVTAAGAARLVGTDERDAASIRRAVVEVLDDPAVRSRAGALAAAFAGLPHPRELVAAVEALARP